MRHNRRQSGRSGLLALVLVTALLSLGIGYAAWTATLTVNSSVQTASISARWMSNADSYPFTAINCTSPQNPLGVGQVSAERDGSDPALMHVEILNGYPGYQANCSLLWQNDGTVPIRSVDHRVNGQLASGLSGVSLDLDGNGEDDVLVRFTNGAGTTPPQGTGTDSLTIIVLSTSTPGAALQFTGTHLFELAN